MASNNQIDDQETPAIDFSDNTPDLYFGNETPDINFREETIPHITEDADIDDLDEPDQFVEDDIDTEEQHTSDHDDETGSDFKKKLFLIQFFIPSKFLK